MSKLLSKNGSSIASPRTNVIFRKISFFSLCLSDREHRGRHIQTDHVPGQRASARPQAQIPAATSNTASIGCGLIRDAA